MVAMEPTVATIHSCLGNLVFGEGDDELQNVVGRLLEARNATLATAEWGTAGLLADWLGETPECHGRYLGGMVLQRQDTTVRTLGLPAELFRRHQPTSGSTIAEAMAAHCRVHFGSDYALAVGQFPKFDPGAMEPATVYFALAGSGGVQVQSHPFTGHPAVLKVFCAKSALNFVRLALAEAPS